VAQATAPSITPIATQTVQYADKIFVVGGADRGEDQRDLVALHQPSRLLRGFRRRIAVIQRNQIDLAAVDAAALIDHPEIADLALAERAERRYRPAIGHGLADPDFGRGDAAHVGGYRGGWPKQQAEYTRHGKSYDNPLSGLRKRQPTGAVWLALWEGNMP
jgi:hypothetical protein